MAIIMTETWKAYEYNLRAGYNNSFECDELIAPSIIGLNKKGYKTEACCSGHLYGDLDEVLYLHKMEDENDIFKTFPNALEYYKLSEECYRVICDNSISSDCYISFDNSVTEFESVPKGFMQERSSDGRLLLRGEIVSLSNYEEYEKMQEEQPYLFFEKRLELMKNLYEWVKGLLPAAEI